jgi:AcrR family transcriptional regulator
MSQPRRTHAQARAEMRAGIIRLGRDQLETRGAADLSVREIARGLSVASSAVYRHVRNRDDLLTLLVVDAYTELADHVERALDRARQEQREHQGHSLGTLAHAVRDWAVEHPARWTLLYGTPVPGYDAEPDDTTAPGTRVMAMFLGIVARGTGGPGGRGSITQMTATDSSSPSVSSVSDELAADLADGINDLDPRDLCIDSVDNVESADGADGLDDVSDLSPDLVADVVTAWSGMIGVISAEIFGQLGADLSAHGSELLDRWITSTNAQLGLG